MNRRAEWARKVFGLAVSTVLVSIFTSLMPGEAGAGEERRSGTVLEVDQVGAATSTLVLRVGPWRLKDEDVVPGSVPLKIVLKPAIDVMIVTRASSAGSSGNDGALTRTRASVEAVRPGSFVTVIFSRIDLGLVADRVEVIPDPLALSLSPPTAPSALVVRAK
jgi:hypothetical protein